MDAKALLAELTALPGPPGQEELVREAVAKRVTAMGLPSLTDAKGNLLVHLGKGPYNVIVTAHMDEIAMIVRSVRPSGILQVGALGGLFPWKVGEGPIQVLTNSGPIDAILSFGSIHTSDAHSRVRAATTGPLDWEIATVFTGRSEQELHRLGVRPGTRAVIHPSRRGPFEIGDLIAGNFFDDRADLVSWLIALEAIKDECDGVLFAATAAEEVGGEGALYVLQEHRPEVCIALELGPDVSDARVDLTSDPTLWVNDSYSAMSVADIELVASTAKELNIEIQYQALSRGGSDASCAASHGLCARPITLGLPMQNSHGFEIMHPGAMEELAKVAASLILKLAGKKEAPPAE